VGVLKKKDKYQFEEYHFEDVLHPLKRVFIAVKNGRSSVMEGLRTLGESEVKEIKSIIKNMVSVENFKSPKVKWNLSKYKYGEIRPKGKRVFFFQKCGDNIVLFDYKEKKKNSLGDNVYKALNKERLEYKREFEKIYR